MNDSKIFLAATGRGLARAAYEHGDQWQVTRPPGSQDIRCLAADPLNKQVVYAGTQGHGVLRSEDRGQTWQSVGLASQIVTSLAISPHDSMVIYAGGKPATLFMTRDGGQQWAELEAFRRIRGRRFWFSPAEPPDRRAYVQAIAISPVDPEVILAGIEFGAVVRSEDGGKSWSNHITNTLRDCHDMKFHANKGWVYEAGGSGGGAAFSQDNGHSWQKSKAGLAKHYGVACAADPERPEVWYVSVAPSPGKAYGREAQAYLYRASAGAAWQPIGWQTHPLPQMPISLVTDPAAPGHLYAGLTYGAIWHSIDYGDSWQKLPFSFDSIWRSFIIL